MPFIAHWKDCMESVMRRKGFLKYDYSPAITAEMAKAAIQTIIIRRDTHIDSLLERLKEERIRSVIEPILSGDIVDINSDDFYYACDLGLNGHIRRRGRLAYYFQQKSSHKLGGKNILQTGIYRRKNS